MSDIDPYVLLIRTLEREERLLKVLGEVLLALDESNIGPASSILPVHQLAEIEAAIESSEEELEMLDTFLASLPDDPVIE